MQFLVPDEGLKGKVERKGVHEGLFFAKKTGTRQPTASIART